MQNKHTTRVQRDTSKVRKGDRQTEGENLGSYTVCLHKQLQNLLLDLCPHWYLHTWPVSISCCHVYSVAILTRPTTVHCICFKSESLQLKLTHAVKTLIKNWWCFIGGWLNVRNISGIWVTPEHQGLRYFFPSNVRQSRVFCFLTFSHQRRQTCAVSGHPARCRPGDSVPQPEPPDGRACRHVPHRACDSSSPRCACPQSPCPGTHRPCVRQGWYPWCRQHSCGQIRSRRLWSCPGTPPYQRPTGRWKQKKAEGQWWKLGR